MNQRLMRLVALVCTVFISLGCSAGGTGDGGTTGGSDTSDPLDDNAFYAYYQEWGPEAQAELCQMAEEEGIQTTVWFIKQGTVEAPEIDIIEVLRTKC